MTAIIIEDERMALALLSRTLNANFPDVEIVGSADSVAAAVKMLGTGPQPDIIFMDVELSDGDCFEIFRRVEVTSRIVMTTAYESYAVKAFETGSVDYLLKPIALDALERAVSRCRERMSGSRAENVMAAEREYRQNSTVRMGDSIIPVAAVEIAYFFSKDKANYLTTHEGNTYIIDSTLDKLEGEIDPSCFFRVSRSCIVSRKAIVSVHKLINGRLRIQSSPEPSFEMTVSRARVDDFVCWLG